MDYKKVFVMILLLPFVLLWDIFYAVIKAVYKGCTFVDQKGEVVLNKIKEKCNL